MSEVVSRLPFVEARVREGEEEEEAALWRKISFQKEEGEEEEEEFLQERFSRL